MRGCNNMCAFCVVPFTRGRERSRSVEDILTEVRSLVAGGTREITLLGQTVDSWTTPRGNDSIRILKTPQPDDLSFPDLLHALGDVPDLKRIRFTSPHPKDCTLGLIAAIRDIPTVCEWIHLPVQSGDDTVLQRMHRGYTRERFLQLVADLRREVPDIAITTDVMVGFPGETEEQFGNTLALFHEVKFDGAYMFIFSSRPGTKAADWDEQVAPDVKSRRLQKLVATQNHISRKNNEALVGRVFETLVDGFGEKPGQLAGLTRQNKMMHFDGPESLVGKIVTVRAEAGFMWGFTGSLEEVVG